VIGTAAAVGVGVGVGVAMGRRGRRHRRSSVGGSLAVAFGSLMIFIGIAATIVGFVIPDVRTLLLTIGFIVLGVGIFLTILGSILSSVFRARMARTIAQDMTNQNMQGMPPNNQWGQQGQQNNQWGGQPQGQWQQQPQQQPPPRPANCQGCGSPAGQNNFCDFCGNRIV